jgi:hypothetical protein
MRFSNLAIAVIGLLVGGGAGYWIGLRVADEQRAVLQDQASTATVSTVVGAIYLLDAGDTAGARKVLFGMGSGALDGLADGAGRVTPPNTEYRASQCKTLSRLRDLRVKDGFLSDPADQALRADPAIAEAEKRRARLLETLRCQ